MQILFEFAFFLIDTHRILYVLRKKLIFRQLILCLRCFNLKSASEIRNYIVPPSSYLINPLVSDSCVIIFPNMNVLRKQHSAQVQGDNTRERIKVALNRNSLIFVLINSIRFLIKVWRNKYDTLLEMFISFLCRKKLIYIFYLNLISSTFRA